MNNTFSDRNNIEYPYEKQRAPGILQISLIYSISVILLAFLGSRAQRSNFYSGILITEFILVLLPPLGLLFFKKYDIKSVLRLNRIGPLNLFLIFWIMIFAIPVVNSANQLYLLFVKYLFGNVSLTSVPPATTAVDLLVNILLIGGSAGICEEVLFRGVLMKGLERFGAGKAVFFTALLFGIWHMYFTSFMGTFLLGILIGYIVYKSNSIFGGMFAHFTNNSIAVFSGFLYNYLSKKFNISGLDTTARDLNEYYNQLLEGPANQLIITIGSLIFTIVFFGAILAGLLIAFKYATQSALVQERKSEGVQTHGVTAAGEETGMPTGAQTGVDTGLRKGGFRWLLPGFAVIGFIYFAEGLALLNMRFEWVDAVLKVMGLK